MKEIHIKVRPDRLNLPLATVCVGKLAAAVFVIEGDIPDDLSGVAVEITRLPNCETTPPTPRSNFTAAAIKQADGTFRAYLNPYNFPDVSDKLAYHIVANDNVPGHTSNPRWLGTGDLRVLNAPTDGSAVAPEILPRDAYAYNPTTGLYYKIRATVDEYGTLSLEPEQEGTEL